MGLRFRKSINLGGGFKVSLSKSGVGYSWGVPGYRITKTAKGSTRKTYSIPNTGLSYTEDRSHNKKNHSKHSPNTVLHNQQSDTLGETKTLDIGDIVTYQADEYNELLVGISNFKKWNLLSNILIATVLLISNPLFILTVIAGIALKIYIRKELIIPLEYTFDEASKTEYENLKNRWKSLCSSKKLWQLTTSTKVLNKKHNAGAENLVDRKKISIFEATPNYLKSNISFITLNLTNEKIYLMPDKIIIDKGLKVGAISYQDLNISCSDYYFIEDESVPKDAKIIDYTWLKVNKNGTPDKRFKGNRKIPVCNYGIVKLTSHNAMDIRLCFSNNELVKNFNQQ